eukprot:1156713_1
MGQSYNLIFQSTYSVSLSHTSCSCAARSSLPLMLFNEQYDCISFFNCLCEYTFKVYAFSFVIGDFPCCLKYFSIASCSYVFPSNAITGFFIICLVNGQINFGGIVFCL